MIKPSIGELLSGVAASLRERVLPEIPAGTTRRQIQAAIGIIARVALVWDKTAPYLYEDNEDIAETLRRIVPVLERIAIDEGNARLQAALAKSHRTLKHTSEPLGPCPSAEVLSARNLEFQEALAELQEALHEETAVQSAVRDNVNVELYALFRRMLTRELQINQPPRRR